MCYSGEGRHRRVIVEVTSNIGWQLPPTVLGSYEPHTLWRRSLRQARYALLTVYPDPLVDLNTLETSQDDVLLKWLDAAQSRLPRPHKMITAEAYRAAIVDLAPKGSFSPKGRPLPPPASGL